MFVDSRWLASSVVQPGAALVDVNGLNKRARVPPVACGRPAMSTEQETV